MDEPNNYPLSDDVANMGDPYAITSPAPYDQNLEHASPDPRLSQTGTNPPYDQALEQVTLDPKINQTGAATPYDQVLEEDSPSSELGQTHSTPPYILSFEHPSPRPAPRPKMSRSRVIGLSSVTGIMSLGVGFAADAVADSREGDPPGTTTTLPPVEQTVETLEPIRCTEMNVNVPYILDADRAKEAVSGIEFFFDDPDMLEQVTTSIYESVSVEEAQGIVQGVFGSRGVNVSFGQRPESYWHESDAHIDPVTHRRALANFVTAYSLVPKNMADYSTDIYLANQIIPNDPEDNMADGYAYSVNPDGTRTTVYNINAFGDFAWGTHIVFHELTHHIDAATCSAEFTAPDPLFDALHGRQTGANESQIDPAGGQMSYFEPNTEYPSLYAMEEGPIEDKADTIAYSTQHYPDLGDSNFERSDLLRDRQEIMMRRLADALDMPEIPMLFQFYDIYGIDQHPKQVVAQDLSPFSISRSPTNPETDLLVPVQVGDNIDNFIVRSDGLGYYAMELEIKLPASEAEDCGNNSQVLELADMSFTVLESLAAPNGMPSTWVNMAEIDPSDGKLVCIIESLSIPADN